MTPPQKGREGYTPKGDLILITVPSRNIVDLAFSTLVFLIRLSLKFYLIDLKDSSTMFRGRLSFKVDYIS